MTESPNWLEMPDDLMVDILQRLPTVQVLKNVRKVCTTWGGICKYPAMWKVINMLKQNVGDWGWDCDLEALTKEAVDFSCGELIDISMERFCTDKLLNHIVVKSNKLKRLCLVRCSLISDSALSLAVKSLPKLEELHLNGTSINAQDLEVIGRNCPQLKYFSMCKAFSRRYDDHALAIANNMSGLRKLGLNDGEVTNNGLQAILNGCPKLRHLDVRYCDKIDPEFRKLVRGSRIRDFKHQLNTKLRVL